MSASNVNAARMHRLFLLPPNSELRISTEGPHHTDGTKCVVIVQSSRAEGSDDTTADTISCEMFGSELPVGVPHCLPAGRTLALFSPTGCSVLVESHAKVLHEIVVAQTSTTTQRNIVQLHSHLDSLRLAARRQGDVGSGPRVMVCGSLPRSGRSTLARMLCNYAVRSGYEPLYCDLCPSLPQFGFPGCLSLFQMQQTFDPEEEAAFLPGLSYLYDKWSPNDNPSLWKHCLEQLAQPLYEKQFRNIRSRFGGIIADYELIDEGSVEQYDDSCLQVAKQSKETFAPGMQGGLLQHKDDPLAPLFDTVEVLEIDHLVIIGSEWLRHRIASHPRVLRRTPGVASSCPSLPQRIAVSTADKDETLDISLIPFLPDDRCGSLSSIEVTEQYRTERRKSRFIRYFCGTLTSPIRPTLVEVLWSECCVVAVAMVNAADMHTMTSIDDDEQRPAANPVVLHTIRPDQMQLEGKVLAVSPTCSMRRREGGAAGYDEVPYKEREEQLRTLSIVGFALIRRSTPTSLTLVISAPSLPHEKGNCFFVTDVSLVIG